MNRKTRIAAAALPLLMLATAGAMAQGSPRDRLAPTPPMGFMTWNMYQANISDSLVRDIADHMVERGYLAAGYNYIFIDDCWQGGRDNRNNIIPDPRKFPHGMKALADYVHERGLRLGIYSDASQQTCAGFTASYGFESQDARTFASWGVDYLKYDYCGAPEDISTAFARYRAMADALDASGRDIVLGVCEWGPRRPWLWARAAGGQLWRTTYDVRDMWKDTERRGGMGIVDIVRQTEGLAEHTGPGHWNDMDMLVVGLRGHGGPSSDLGGKGCTWTEYQTQMSLWCMMASPLQISHDILNEDDETRRILLNAEILAICQDTLGRAARKALVVDGCDVYVRELAGGRHAVAILNAGESEARVRLPLRTLGISGGRPMRDVWAHTTLPARKEWVGSVAPHETKVFVVE